MAVGAGSVCSAAGPAAAPVGAVHSQTWKKPERSGGVVPGAPWELVESLW